MNVIQLVCFSFKIVVISRLFAYILFNLLIRVIIRVIARQRHDGFLMLHSLAFFSPAKEFLFGSVLI